MKVFLAGNSLAAHVLYSYIQKDARYEILGTVVDDHYVGRSLLTDIADVTISQLASRFDRGVVSVIMAVGYSDLNRTREDMMKRVKSHGFKIETYIHPDAKVYTQHPLGEGCVVLPSVVIEPHVRVGANSMIWANTTLAHHCSVAENCWVASGAIISGSATVKRNSFIGVNATIVNDVTVEEYCIIGAGALVTRNTKPSSVHLARSGEEHRFPSQEYVKFTGF